MKKKLLVEITYRGEVEFNAPKETFDTFVSSVLPDIGLRSSLSIGWDGSYRNKEFEFVKGRIVRGLS